MADLLHHMNSDYAKPCQQETVQIPRLNLRQIIGFNGRIAKGLLVHPDNLHLVYAVGCNIVIERITKKGDGPQQILSNHTETVTAIAISSDGRFIASGQQQRGMVDKATVILWDYSRREPVMEWPGHTQHVEAIAFTKSNHCFITLGAPDDGHVMVWGVGLKKPLVRMAAQPRRNETARAVATSKRDASLFITAGRGHGRLWTISDTCDTVEHTPLNFGYTRHEVVCIETADMDCLGRQMAFCGTSSGDVLVFSMTNGNIQTQLPKKPIPHGVRSVTYLRMLNDSTFSIIIGTGDGKVMNYDMTLTLEKDKRVKGVAKLAKPVWSNVNEPLAITSISKLDQGFTVYVGSASCQMYEFNLRTWSAQLLRTCCHTPVTALTFARGTDDLLVTGELNQIRVFNLHVNAEVRRYVRAGRTCMSVVVNHDGTKLFTGWDNGETLVLGFEPRCMTMKELYRIDCSQKQAVTALALTSDSNALVTGGNDGQTRVWRLVDDINYRGQRLRQGLLLHLLTQQTAPISAVQITGDDQKVMCASHDGSVVVYCLATSTVLHHFRIKSPLLTAGLCMQDLQVVTAGNDGMIRQWEILTGELLRENPACRIGAVNTLSVRKDVFVTGGDDALVKLWNLNEGEITHIGRGHSESVLRSVIGPCGTLMVTSAKDGTLCVWDLPCAPCDNAYA